MKNWKLNSLLLKGEASMKVLSVLPNNDFEVLIAIKKEGINRNNWNIKNVNKYYSTYAGRPILCAFPNGQIGDGHNHKLIRDSNGNVEISLIEQNSEIPVGTISPIKGDVWTEKVKNELWIMAKGVIWTDYFAPLVRKIIQDERMDVSAEYKHNSETAIIENGIEVHNDWYGIGVTLLGDAVNPAVENAKIKKYDYEAISNMPQFMQLRAASYNQDSNKENLDKNNPTKGVKKTMPVVINKTEIIKKLAEKFPDSKVINTTDDGKIPVLLRKGTIQTFNLANESDHGIEEKYYENNVVLMCKMQVGEEVCELSADNLISILTEDSQEQIKTLVAEKELLAKSLEVTQATLLASDNKIKELELKEEDRKKEMCVNALKNERLQKEQKLTDEQKTSEDDFNAIVKKAEDGFYNNCLSVDGKFIGIEVAIKDYKALYADKQDVFNALQAERNNREVYTGGTSLYQQNNQNKGTDEARRNKYL